VICTVARLPASLRPPIEAPAVVAPCLEAIVADAEAPVRLVAPDPGLPGVAEAVVAAPVVNVVTPLLAVPFGLLATIWK
jgi:hypothetical protein